MILKHFEIPGQKSLTTSETIHDHLLTQFHPNQGCFITL